jgi:hypothetical protein
MANCGLNIKIIRGTVVFFLSTQLDFAFPSKTPNSLNQWPCTSFILHADSVL